MDTNFNDAKKFIETILEPLSDDQTYLMLAMARKKYEPKLVKSSQIVMAREIIKSIPLEPYEKLIKMTNTIKEVYFKGELIPDHAKACYLCINPTDTVKAWHSFVEKVNKYQYDFLKQPKLSKNPMKSLDRTWFGCLQASATKGKYFIIDVDNPELFDLVYSKLERSWIKWISKTRGGYHFIVEKNDRTGRLIHLELNKHPEIEITRHGLTPIVGTIQGGHKVAQVQF